MRQGWARAADNLCAKQKFVCIHSKREKQISLSCGGNYQKQKRPLNPLCQEGDTYTLFINNPVLEDDGTYILLVKEVEAKTSGYLTVRKRDPEYYFVRPLKEQELGYTNRWVKSF